MTGDIRFLASPRLPSEESLLGYVDGLLDPRERAQVEGYLARHPEEARRIGAYQRQARLLHATYDGVYAEPLPPELLAATERLQRQLRRPSLARRLTRLAAGLVLFAAVGGLAWQGYRHASEPDLRLALEDYWEQGMRLAFDEGEPGQEAEETLPIRLEALPGPEQSPEGGGAPPSGAPDLSALGLQLVSARMLSGGEPGAMELIYESDARARVMLYFSRSDSPVSSRMAVLQEGSLSLLFWNQQGRSFGLVSELAREELLAVGAAVQEAWRDFPAPGNGEGSGESLAPAPAQPGSEGEPAKDAPDTSAS